MTKEQKQAYLKSPNHCPFCNSDNIASESIQADSDIATAYVECLSCSKKWNDIFTITDVEEVEGP